MTRVERLRKRMEGGAIRIRALQAQDRAAVRDLCKQAHAETFLGRHPLDLGKLDRVITHILDPDTVDAGLVAEHAGGGSPMIVGLLHATAGEHLYLDLRLVTCQMLYVAPAFRHTTAALRLMRHLIQRARNSEVEMLALHVTSGVRLRQSARFLHKLGFHQTGGSYHLPLARSGPAA